MLAKTGLLIVSNPKQIGKILPSVQKQVKNILYIQLLSALTDSSGNFHSNTLTSWPKYSQTISGIYSQAAAHCKNLDVRVLLSGLKYKNLSKIQTICNIDLVIFDQVHNPSEIDKFILGRVGNIAKDYQVLTLDSGDFKGLDANVDNENVRKHTVLGGTFDRLHIAHKLLLSEAVLRSNSIVTIGVTEENMIKSKTLWELIQDIDVRINNVKEFLKDICQELDYRVVPINDPFGPAIIDPTMELIVVSEETTRGGEKINEIRECKGLEKLEIIPIRLIDEPNPYPFEEVKISSSTSRIRLLGTLLRPIEEKSLPRRPYVIGLTGGVASGKSGVAKWLSLRGAQIVNCDIIGHDVYKPGKPCHKLLVEHFGESVLTSEGEINRRVLGGIVFKDAEEMKNLNSIVWPAIAEEVNDVILKSSADVVVVEAAVLIMANWQKFCHEVWTTLVPREEAVKRLINRNNLTEEQAASRIDAQPSNSEFVENANVVFCPLWAEEFTKQQVDNAWDLLQSRLL